MTAFFKLCALFADFRYHRKFVLAVYEQIRLVRRDYSRSSGKVVRELFKLCGYRFKVFKRSSAFLSRYVHHLNEHTAAFDVSEEVVTETRALRCSFDKSGNIRHDKARFAAG